MRVKTDITAVNKRWRDKPWLIENIEEFTVQKRMCVCGNQTTINLHLGLVSKISDSTKVD